MCLKVTNWYRLSYFTGTHAVIVFFCDNLVINFSKLSVYIIRSFWYNVDVQSLSTVSSHRAPLCAGGVLSQLDVRTIHKLSKNKSWGIKPKIITLTMCSHTQVLRSLCIHTVTFLQRFY